MKCSLPVIASQVLVVLIMLSYQTCLHAQTREARKVTSPSAAAYAEVGGPALGWLSLNGEACIYRFEHDRVYGNVVHSLRVSIGTTVAPVDRCYLPVGVKLLMLESDHHIEVGTGLSMLLKVDEVDDGFEQPFPASPVVVFFGLGYRFEPQTGGFQFRWVYSPVYEFTTAELYSYFGISVGLSF